MGAWLLYGLTGCESLTVNNLGARSLLFVFLDYLTFCFQSILSRPTYLTFLLFLRVRDWILYC
jgi:hypothetical protein